jgi:hypothetical protein
MRCGICLMTLPYLSSPPIVRTEKEGQRTMIQSGNIHPETISPASTDLTTVFPRHLYKTTRYSGAIVRRRE